VKEQLSFQWSLLPWEVFFFVVVFDFGAKGPDGGKRAFGGGFPDFGAIEGGGERPEGGGLRAFGGGVRVFTLPGAPLPYIGKI